MQIHSVVVASCLILFLGACSESATERLGEAQYCLDGAAPAAAQDCVRSISDLKVPLAYALRCSAGFITEGFGQGVRFKTAVEQIVAGAGDTVAFLGYFTFSSQGSATANRTFSEQTYENCDQSNQKSLRFLGAMALIATVVSEAGGLTWDSDNPPSTTDIRAALTTMKNSVNPTTVEAVEVIGEAGLNILSRSCSMGNSPSKNVCEELQRARSGATGGSQDFGYRLIDEWD